jgi:hypothetical protein
MAISQSTSAEASFTKVLAASESPAHTTFDDRHLTVGDHLPSERLRPGAKNLADTTAPSPVPFLRLQGRWLKEAGFAKGTKVRVNVTSGCLIIKPVPMVSERRPRLPREGTFYLSITHKY